MQGEIDLDIWHKVIEELGFKLRDVSGFTQNSNYQIYKDKRPYHTLISFFYLKSFNKWYASAGVGYSIKKHIKSKSFEELFFNFIQPYLIKLNET